jgi:hypothetical protein
VAFLALLEVVIELKGERDGFRAAPLFHESEISKFGDLNP